MIENWREGHRAAVHLVWLSTIFRTQRKIARRQCCFKWKSAQRDANTARWL